MTLKRFLRPMVAAAVAATVTVPVSLLATTAAARAQEGPPESALEAGIVDELAPYIPTSWDAAPCPEGTAPLLFQGVPVVTDADGSPVCVTPQGNGEPGDVSPGQPGEPGESSDSQGVIQPGDPGGAPDQ